MLSMGCDYHPGVQQIAWIDKAPGSADGGG